MSYEAVAYIEQSDTGTIDALAHTTYTLQQFLNMVRKEPLPQPAIFKDSVSPIFLLTNEKFELKHFVRGNNYEYLNEYPGIHNWTCVHPDGVLRYTSDGWYCYRWNG